MSAVAEAFRIERSAQDARRVAKRRRTPLLVHAGRVAARVLPRWRQARTAAMSVGGFGMMTAAAWQVHVALGLAVGGVSLLILEALTGDGR